MIKLGSVCPLFFNPLKDRFSLEIGYIQRFYTSDKVIVQILSDRNEVPVVSLRDLITGYSEDIALSIHKFNDSITLYYFILTGLDDSVYTVSIDGIGISEPFAFCSSELILNETSLIRYSHKDNNSIDDIFWIGEEQQVFEIRYECGFKPSGITLNVEVEHFRNQDQEIIGMYSIPYKTMRFSVGDSAGIPYWFGEHLNKILCLSKIDINGAEYVRSEASVVEMAPVMEHSQIFFISALLEPRYNEVHGMGGEIEISGGGNTQAGIILMNPKDGEVLVYNARVGAIVNENIL